MTPEFRVWDKADKVYDVPTQIDIDDSGHIICVDTYHGSIADGDFLLEQYTGLKDVNGNKIFEGDILHTDYEINYVTFQDYGFCTHNSQPLINYVFNTATGTPKFTDNRFKVIGNIHENLELMEVDE